MRKNNGWLSSGMLRMYFGIAICIIGYIAYSFDIYIVALLSFIISGLWMIMIILRACMNSLSQNIIPGMHSSGFTWLRMLLSIRCVKLPWNRKIIFTSINSIDTSIFQTEDCANKMFGVGFNHHRRNYSVRSVFYSLDQSDIKNYKTITHSKGPKTNTYFKLGYLFEDGSKLPPECYNIGWSNFAVKKYQRFKTEIKCDFKENLGEIIIYSPAKEIILCNYFQIPKNTWFIYNLYAYIGGNEPAKNYIKISN